MFEPLAEMFGTTVKSYVEANAIDESKETPVLLAREAGNSILRENGDEAEYLVETPEGFIVSGDRHAIFMGHNGSFQLADIPTDDDPQDEDEEIDIDILFADLDDEVPEDATIEDLSANLEVAMAEVELTTEVVSALSEFDAAKVEGSMEKALAAMDHFDEAAGTSVSRGKLIPVPAEPAAPSIPLDQGPGPAKNTSAAGSSGSSIPTTAAPAPKTPDRTGPGVKPAQKEAEDGKVEFLVESVNIQEFIRIAQKAGAPADAEVALEGDKYKVLLPSDVARAVNATWA